MPKKSKGLNTGALTARLEVQFERALVKRIKEKEEEIRRKAANLQKFFFKMLIRRGIGVTTAPDLGEYTPVWEPLVYNKKSYPKKSRKQRNLDKFYKHTGQLENHLNKLNPAAVFGAPTLGFDYATTARSVSNEEWVVNKLNKLSGQMASGFKESINKIMRIANGQFASAASIKRKRLGYIRIDMLPGMKDKSSNRAIAQFFDRFPQPYSPDSKYGRSVLSSGNRDKLKSRTIATKFLNPRYKEKRPLIGPFTKWWLNVHIRQRLASSLREGGVI